MIITALFDFVAEVFFAITGADELKLRWIYLPVIFVMKCLRGVRAVPANGRGSNNVTYRFAKINNI
jgi:hypothetical protein